MNNSQDTILSAVRDFANRAHSDQRRRYVDAPYIVHPVRVMETCRAYTQDTATLCAALLHDVLEDTPVREASIGGFLETLMPGAEVARTLRTVVELTDVYTRERQPRMKRKERRAREAERLATVSADAQTVKYADIIDNAVDITQHDPDFAPVYVRECQAILALIDKGNAELYQRALSTLEECLERFPHK
ncbi:HD domain-containing protein [Fulvivirgaceae bacterium PWU5]|uniref:HD domain-containing protein n=1 Tax=Dawidia cretensis TaxID=2782350 RepID=A0AAP2DZH2_9BACT|nr:HD domain-containing protein [Dawidia cretensis]MBT1708892.1 HD domain-containing protein [Dawidia cretensis]